MSNSPEPLEPRPLAGPDPLDEIELQCLVGPTAGGKSALSCELAESAGAEIVSLDSMLVYRGMDVGTAKPDAAQRARAPHHMLDLVGPSERYDARRFLQDLRGAVAAIVRRGARPLFVGGTAFYLKLLVHGLFEGPPADLELRAHLRAEAERVGPEAFHARLAAVDPAAALRIHPHDLRRSVRALEVLEQTGRPLSEWQREWGWHGRPARARARRVVGLELSPDELDGRIAERTRAMLDAGWVEEACAIERGEGFGPTARQALGYREVLALSRGELGREECQALIALRTRQFARRQRTWYRKFPEIEWIPAARSARALVDSARSALGW